MGLKSYVQLQYYRFELHTGLYFLQPLEKVVLNAVMFGTVALFAYGSYNMVKTMAANIY